MGVSRDGWAMGDEAAASRSNESVTSRHVHPSTMLGWARALPTHHQRWQWDTRRSVLGGAGGSNKLIKKLMNTRCILYIILLIDIKYSASSTPPLSTPPLLPPPHLLTADSLIMAHTPLLFKNTQCRQFLTQKSPVGDHSVSYRHACGLENVRHCGMSPTCRRHVADKPS